MLGPIDRLALSRTKNELLSTFTVVALQASFTGDSCAAVIQAREQHDQRLSFTIPWAEVNSFTTLLTRLQKLFFVFEKELVESTFIADTTSIGASSLDNITLTVGQMPFVIVEAPETKEATDDGPFKLCPEDRFGALQSALALGRLQMNSKLAVGPRLLGAAKGLTYAAGKFAGSEDAALRAASLGLYWAMRSLGDSSLAPPEPVIDEKEKMLAWEKEQEEFAKGQVGTMDWSFWE